MGRASALLKLRKICTLNYIEMGTSEAKNNLNQYFLKPSLLSNYPESKIII